MTILLAIDSSYRIGFSKFASLLRVHLKNLVIFVKLDHLRILQLPVLIYQMVHCWRQLNLLMCVCVVRHDFVLQLRSKVAYCTHLLHTLLRNTKYNKVHYEVDEKSHEVPE